MKILSNSGRVLCAALFSFSVLGIAQASTLFERIGGQEKLHAVVDEFVKVIIDDDRINFSFANTDLSKFNNLLYEQLCELTRGPCNYTGRDMQTAHAKLNINDAQFNALAEDLYKAFDRVHVPYRVQNQVIALLAPMQRDIVKPRGFVAPGTQPPPASIR
jgi:hemoglobin